MKNLYQILLREQGPRKHRIVWCVSNSAEKAEVKAWLSWGGKGHVQGETQVTLVATEDKHPKLNMDLLVLESTTQNLEDKG